MDIAGLEECKAIAGLAGVQYGYNSKQGIVLWCQHPEHGYRQIALKEYDPAAWRKACAELLSDTPQPLW